jgi:hypothetical protein
MLNPVVMTFSQWSTKFRFHHLNDEAAVKIYKRIWACKILLIILFRVNVIINAVHSCPNPG